MLNWGGEWTRRDLVGDCERRCQAHRLNGEDAVGHGGWRR